MIDSHESCFRFLSRSIPIFLREQVVVKPGEKKLIQIESPFVEEISGMAIVKIIDQGQKTLIMLKLKFIWNKATLDITNNMRETLIFDRKTIIGILDLIIIRSNKEYYNKTLINIIILRKQIECEGHLIKW